jgi:rod shape-determining protein MreC
LALIATDTRLQYLNIIRHQLEAYLHPLTLMVNAPMELYRQADDYLTSHNRLLSENEALKKHLLKANAGEQAMTSLKVENRNFRNLFNLKAKLEHQSFLAEILHATSDQLTRKIVVNRGASHGVHVGGAAVDAKGIVGQVTRVYAQTSVVTLITDSSLQIPIMVERNGLRAIAFGNGRDNVLEIPYLPSNVDINIGDRLATSGLDGVYPAGITVGVVQKISVARGSSFVSILCAPVGGVDYHKQVLIVNPADNTISAEEKEVSVSNKEQSHLGAPKKEPNHLSAAGKLKPADFSGDVGVVNAPQ